MADDRTMAMGAAPVAADAGAAALGSAAGLAGLVSAAACCVLPLALSGIGVAAGGLGMLVPLHWPLTIVSALAIAAGWALYARKRRACADGCAAPPSRTIFAMLCFATAAALLSAIWPYFVEKPLMAMISGA